MGIIDRDGVCIIILINETLRCSFLVVSSKEIEVETREEQTKKIDERVTQRSTRSEGSKLSWPFQDPLRSSVKAR